MADDFDFDMTAERLRADGKLQEALMLCLEGLTKFPDRHRGRLVLARVLFELGFRPFALREVDVLCEALPHRDSLRALRAGLQPVAAQSGQSAEEGVVAEEEINFDEIDLLDEDENK